MIKGLLGRRISALRRSKGLAQERLAEKSGYSAEFISRIERGINSPSVDGLERIAHALCVEIKDLFDFSEISK